MYNLIPNKARKEKTRVQSVNMKERTTKTHSKISTNQRTNNNTKKRKI